MHAGWDLLSREKQQLLSSLFVSFLVVAFADKQFLATVFVAIAHLCLRTFSHWLPELSLVSTLGALTCCEGILAVNAGELSS